MIGLREGSLMDGEYGMQWPFKTIRQDSTWPLQGMVVSMAAAVLDTPEDARKAALYKNAERLYRVVARVAGEFGASPVVLLDIARKQLEREIPGAKERIADALAEDAGATIEAAAALTTDIFGALKKGDA